MRSNNIKILEKKSSAYLQYKKSLKKRDLRIYNIKILDKKSYA